MKNLYSTVKQLQEREFDPKQTLHVLKAELYVFLSWGVKRLVNFDNKALGLLVNGKHYKFWVIITLNSGDLYDVTFLKRDFSVRAKMKDLYFDQLAEMIDWAVESRSGFIKEIAMPKSLLPVIGNHHLKGADLSPASTNLVRLKPKQNPKVNFAPPKIKNQKNR